MILKIFAVCLLLCSIVYSGKIVYSGTVVRHGARYPIRGDIYDGNASKANAGKLTSVGMRQHYLLGSYMRADYIDKQNQINSTLYTKQVQAFSDTSQRCQISTICFLLGLFPFGSGEKIPQNLDQSMLEPPFQSTIQKYLRQQNIQQGEFGLKYGLSPVPIRHANSYFPKCPNQAKIIQTQIKNAAIKIAEFQAVQAAFTQKMRLVFNLSAQYSNIAGLAELFDVVTCDMYLGRDLPTQFTDYDYQQLTFIHDYLFAIIYGGQAAKIFSTSVLQGILQNMDNIVNNSTGRIKYSLYGGHDTNVMPILMFFNLTSPECLSRKWKNQTHDSNCADAPPFASSLVFELHSNSNQQTNSNNYYVKIRYNGVYYNVCNTEQKQCAYQKFAQLVRNQMVDVNKECGIKTQNNIEILVQ